MLNSKDQEQHIAGPAGALEALVAQPSTEPRGVAIVLHPHPVYGGTMHNKVAFQLARSMLDLGLVALRFNFRGVEGSAGEYGEGVGETDDALSVYDWARQQWPGLPIWVAGFSFGGWIACKLAHQRPVTQLITVAPATRYMGDHNLTAPDCPWLLIQGGADDVVPHKDVLNWVADMPKPPATVLLPDCGHFFHGQLGLLKITLHNHLGATR